MLSREFLNVHIVPHVRNVIVNQDLSALENPIYRLLVLLPLSCKWRKWRFLQAQERSEPQIYVRGGYGYPLPYGTSVCT